MKAIIGKKIGMTRVFDEKGMVIPVTLISVGENVITQVKTADTDGYEAAQVGMVENKKINKPLSGHLAKTKIKSRTFKEFHFSGLELGQKLDLTQFEEGEAVFAQNISKGKGWAGVVKRHHFNTGPRTHGSDNYRRPGSIGATGPQRVIKGRRMAGQMGFEQVTQKNIKIVSIDIEKNILMVKGAIPGPNKSTVYIWSNNAIKAKNEENTGESNE
ncbi:TPA: 50S ribosomal protein L3 [Candidatus Berkelbacteria bacterium]|uniref:Large ribosomal subunit protein uL3 n=1 Tax=Berkelbacteria bacterium GW2011_GWE1_39_12 TaxID=1618337 RepID=A0A0G4B507_9BACT|nr:MAG: 50S ribosomal protein L3, large subunit ribosomal protein L3 [Berkelbacteria bacterium GW2011_GWE1_39_12]HBO60228.1 50S ribosomal protein L3 [Candidatus Berkelbacteria bacterium]